MKVRLTNAILLLALLLAGCVTTKPPQRYAWVTGLKPDEAAHYEDLHQHIWPGVNRTIKSCHIQNFSIHKCEIGGKLYLFAYLEYTGSDFAADMKRMGDDPETQRWWKQNRSLPVAVARRCRERQDLVGHEGGLFPPLETPTQRRLPPGGTLPKGMHIPCNLRRHDLSFDRLLAAARSLQPQTDDVL